MSLHNLYIKNIERMVKKFYFFPNNDLLNCFSCQLTSPFVLPSLPMPECSQYPASLGGSTLESFWTLAVVLPALEVIFSIEMFLQCLLHPKMNMRLKFSLPLKEEYLQYLLSWVLSAFHSQAGSLIFCTVHVVECLGMQKVLSYFHFFIIISN